MKIFLRNERNLETTVIYINLLKTKSKKTKQLQSLCIVKESQTELKSALIQIHLEENPKSESGMGASDLESEDTVERAKKDVWVGRVLNSQVSKLQDTFYCSLQAKVARRSHLFSWQCACLMPALLSLAGSSSMSVGKGLRWVNLAADPEGQHWGPWINTAPHRGRAE